MGRSPHLWPRRTATVLVAASLTVGVPSALPAFAADAPPDTTIGAPAPNAVVAAPVAVQGGATDDVGVASAQVAVRDTGTLQYWTGTGWVAGLTWLEARVASPGAVTTGWSYSFAPSGGSGRYSVTARAVDTAGTVDATRPLVPFAVGTPDATAPDTTVSAPTANAVVTAPVSVTGGATDAVGVTAVDVGVRDRTTNQWWNGTTWVAALAWNRASLGTAGATTTTWAYAFSPVGGSGSYTVTARAKDAAGNVDAQRPSVAFSVAAGAVPRYTGLLAGPGVADITPVDVAATASRYYVLDVARYRVAAVDRASGAVVDEVGGTRSGDTGDLAAARSIAVDTAGNVYIADTPNSRVTKYDANLDFVAQWGTKGAGAGQFTQVYGLAVGTGRRANNTLGEILYAIDGDGRISRWSLGGAYLGAFAGGTVLNQPRMAEVNRATNDLWVVNARDRQVVVLRSDGTERFRFGAQGTGNGQFMGDPRGIAISRDGTRVFVSDEGNHRIQVFDAAGTYLSQIAAAPGTASYLVDARGLDTTPDGKLVVSDEWDHSLKQWTQAGAFEREYFGGAAPVGGVNAPRGLAVDAAGRVLVSDWWNQRVQRITPGGDVLAWGRRGTRDDPGSINFAWDVAVQPGTGRVFLANRESHEIEVFTSDGAFVTRWGSRGSAPGDVTFPHGLAFDRDGTLLVTDSGNARIQRFAVDAAGNGSFLQSYGGTGTAAGQFNTPTGIDVAADGTIWVADTRNHRIQKRSPATGAWTAYTRPAGTSVTFSVPWGVSVGPDGDVWVADSGRNRIVRATADMVPVFVADAAALGVPGALSSPYEVEFGPAGRIYVSDTFNNRVLTLQES